MIKGFLYLKNKLIAFDISRLKSSKSLKKGKLFVAAYKPSPNEIKLLSEKFNLHPTTQEDISSTLTRIKYEEFDDNTFIVIKGIKKIKKITISFYTIFLIDGDRYLIAVYYDDNDTLKSIVDNPKKIEPLLKKGEDNILHYIVDKEVDKYLDLRTQLSEQLKVIESAFIKKPTKELLNTLFSKEKIAIEIKQRIDTLTDVCLRLTKPTENFIQNSLIPYFRDIYDHSFRANEGFKTYLERINALRNAYLSLASNRMNETIRILTILMVLLMPMTVITGFYGMNIKLPIQMLPNAYEILIGIMLFIVIFLLYIFKKKGWLNNNI